MSDIQEEQKRLYKRAEENDRTDTINIQDLFNERIEQNKRVEELVNINEKLSLALESAEQRIGKARRILGQYAHYSTPTEEQNAKNEAIVDEAYMKLHNNLKELKGDNK